MFNLFKKTLCITLAMLMLLCVFASCKKDEEDPVKSSGELGAPALTTGGFYVWTGDGEMFEDLEGSTVASYDELKTKLAEGGRLNEWRIRLKDVDGVENKKLTKVSFTLEADRKVTLTVATRYTNKGAYSKKTVTLEPNKAQKIEIEFSNCIIDDENLIFVEFWQKQNDTNSEKDDYQYDYKSAELAAWSQTVYEVTEFKLFCE